MFHLQEILRCIHPLFDSDFDRKTKNNTLKLNNDTIITIHLDLKQLISN